jgi:putative Holliday junction resolvase
VRALGVDLGERRIGLAISDATGTLARPLATLTVRSADAVEQVSREIVRLAAEEDGLAVIVVGVPTTLHGEASDGSARATRFMAALRTRTTILVVGEDERLSSHEADQRLSFGERDWRKRKHKLDAAAAAVFLQDFLDRRERHLTQPDHGAAAAMGQNPCELDASEAGPGESERTRAARSRPNRRGVNRSAGRGRGRDQDRNDRR